MPLIKKRKKWLVFLLSILILIALTFSGIRIFQYYHPTYYKFNDRFIIGNSIENIEDRYGPLEFAGYTSDGLKIGRYFADEGVPDIDIASLWSPTYDLWYDIYFDENHIAQKVSLETMV